MNSTVELILRANSASLVRGLRTSEQAISSFSASSRQKISSITRDLAVPLAGIATGGAVLAAGKQIVDFDANLVRFANNGDMATSEMMRLRDEITTIAAKDGVFREQILAGNAAIVQRTGNVKLAVDTMKDLSDVSLASGAAMDDLGGMTANLSQKFNLGAKEMRTAFGALMAQGKAGSFELADFATQGERIFSAAARFNRGGLKGVREVGALVQLAKMGTASPEQAATAVENVYSNIIDKQKKLEKLGVRVWENKKLGKYRDALSIIQDLIVKTGNDQQKLNDIFGAEGVRGVTALSKMYADTKSFSGVQSFIDAGKGRESAVILQDMSRYSETAQASFRRLYTNSVMLADTALAPALTEIANAVSDLSSNDEFIDFLKKSALFMGSLTSSALELAPAIATLIAGMKILKATGTDITLGKRGAGKNPADVAGEIGVQHVWVDNIHEISGGGVPGGSRGGKGKIHKSSPNAPKAEIPAEKAGGAGAFLKGVQEFLKKVANSRAGQMVGKTGTFVGKTTTKAARISPYGLILTASKLGTEDELSTRKAMYSIDNMKQQRELLSTPLSGNTPLKQSGTAQIVLKDVQISVDQHGNAKSVRTGSYDLFGGAQ